VQWKLAKFAAEKWEPAVENDDGRHEDNTYNETLILVSLLRGYSCNIIECCHPTEQTTQTQAATDTTHCNIYCNIQVTPADLTISSTIGVTTLRLIEKTNHDVLIVTVH